MVSNQLMDLPRVLFAVRWAHGNNEEFKGLEVNPEMTFRH